MKKSFSLAIALVLGLASATASAGIITFTDSIKRGAAQHMVIDGLNLLLRGNSLGKYNTNRQRYSASLRDTNNGSRWDLNLRIGNISNTFAPGHSPRCPRTEPGCDTSSWLHFTESPDRRSTLTRGNGNARYVLDLGWGQYGYNAGGHWVTAQDANAAGFWIKEWRYQRYSDQDNKWIDRRKGTGGDINVYQTVSEPAGLGLLGLAGLILLRRKRTQR